MMQQVRRYGAALGVMVALALISTVTHATGTPAPRTILVMGDSLSAGYGLAADEGWVSLLAKRLATDGPPGWRVANASVSGETTAGGASRVADELAHQRPAVVVIELGANDGLRGLPLDAAKANLAKMIAASRAAGARVLLVGMRIPPNYGREYSESFAAMYRDLAREHDVASLPFLFETLGDARDRFQDDNVHPTAAAQPTLLDHVWSQLAPLLRETSAPSR